MKPLTFPRVNKKVLSSIFSPVRARLPLCRRNRETLEDRHNRETLEGGVWSKVKRPSPLTEKDETRIPSSDTYDHNLSSLLEVDLFLGNSPGVGSIPYGNTLYFLHGGTSSLSEDLGPGYL